MDSFKIMMLDSIKLWIKNEEIFNEYCLKGKELSIKHGNKEKEEHYSKLLEENVKEIKELKKQRLKLLFE